MDGSSDSSCINETSIPDTWDELQRMMCPIDLDALKISSLLQERRKEVLRFGALRSTTGALSLISSAAIIWHILRSNNSLSTTYHRLVFGLCVGDILSSLAHFASTSTIPSEMNYFIPYAVGNKTTCDAQGFFLLLGVGITAMYNSSICIYYLAIIKYSKKEEYIRTTLEPWFHGISTIAPITFAIIVLVNEAFNAADSMCFFWPNRPPHCNGYNDTEIPKGFKIPCGRGDLTDKWYGSLLGVGGHMLLIATTPAVIVITMMIMYRSILKIELKLQRYGVGALRLRAQRFSRFNNRPIMLRKCGTTSCSSSSGIHENENEHSFIRRKLASIYDFSTTCFHRNSMSRSNNIAFQKRAVLHMAIGYGVAWFFTFAPYILYYFSKTEIPLVLPIFTPLQGLYNLIVYMSPKVRSAHISRIRKVSWREAIVKAWLSKGEERKGRGFRPRNIQSSRLRSLSRQLSRQFSNRSQSEEKRRKQALFELKRKEHGINSGRVQFRSIRSDGNFYEEIEGITFGRRKSVTFYDEDTIKRIERQKHETTLSQNCEEFCLPEVSSHIGLTNYLQNFENDESSMQLSKSEFDLSPHDELRKSLPLPFERTQWAFSCLERGETRSYSLPSSLRVQRDANTNTSSTCTDQVSFYDECRSSL